MPGPEAGAFRLISLLCLARGYIIFRMATNIPMTVLGYLLTVGATLLWIFKSRQKRVPRTGRTAIGTSLRMLPLFLLLFVVSHRLNVSPAVVLVILAGVFWMLLITPGWLGMGAIGVLYVLQQWILGWPDHDDFVLAPPSLREVEPVHWEELTGKVGVAKCPLRPGGIVVLAEMEYPAYSDLGYIDRGVRVIVVGKKGTSLLVRPTGLTSDTEAQS